MRFFAMWATVTVLSAAGHLAIFGWEVLSLAPVWIGEGFFLALVGWWMRRGAPSVTAEPTRGPDGGVPR